MVLLPDAVELEMKIGRERPDGPCELEVPEIRPKAMVRPETYLNLG